MKLHANARLVPERRLETARRVSSVGLTRPAAALAYGVTAKTAAKWTVRYEEGGEAALADRSSRPSRLRSPTPPAVRAEGLSRARNLEPKEDDRRYEHDAPGDMIRLDIKKLGRFARPDQWGLATG